MAYVRAGKTAHQASASAPGGSAGTPGTSSEVRGFVNADGSQNRACRPVIVMNDEAVDCYVSIGTAGASTASFQFKVAADSVSGDLSMGGQLAITHVSLWLASGAFANVKVWGWSD